jgi:hypothetical protein
MPQLPMLAGDGPVLIHATVSHHPTPQSAPPNLESFVSPIRDADGSVKDWRLNDEGVAATRTEFSRWHDGFVSEAVVGDVATVRALRSWGRGRVELSELGILQLPHARVSSRHARKMAWQLHSAAEECAKANQLGLGVSSSEHAGLARGFVCQEGPLMLLTEGNAWVAATPAGLLVHTDENPDTTLLVHGWSALDGHVSVITDDGEVDLHKSRAGKLLTRVAPGLESAVVRQVPLTTIFAGLFVTLADMALMAALGNTALRIDRTNPLAP